VRGKTTIAYKSRIKKVPNRVPKVYQLS